MMLSKYQLIRNFAIPLAICGVMACKGDSEPTTTDSSSSTTETTSESTTADETSTTSSGSETDTDKTTSTTEPDTSSSSTGEEVCMPDDGVDNPDGEDCMGNCDCASEQCFVVPFLGGLCGECTKDADCPNGGCTIPNPLKSPAVGSRCNMGEPGAGCESDEVCSTEEAPLCGTVLDTPIITLKTCGVCLDHNGCGGDTPYCEPDIDILNVSGQLACVGAASIPNDKPCTLSEDANAQNGGSENPACMSGKCSFGDVIGLATIGICGECLTHDDCNGKQCMPAVVNTNQADMPDQALKGSFCQ